MDTTTYRSIRPDLPGRDPVAELAAVINRRSEPVIVVARRQYDALIAAGADPARAVKHAVGGPLPGEIWLPQ